MNLLETEDFQTYLTGCVRTEQTADGLFLHRHTKKQTDYYAKANESWSIRSRCPAGIQLRLQTDSQTLDMAGFVRDGARTYAGVDVEVDGRAITALRLDTSEEEQTLRLFEFPNRAMRQVTVTFPQSAIVELLAVTLEDDAQIAPFPESTTKYLAIGDSITQGMDARGPASAYVVQLARMMDAELLNLGVGGHIFDLDAMDDDLPYTPDIVTVAYGTNDWTREFTREQIADTTTQYLSRLLDTVAKSAKVYVLTPLWRAIGEEVKPGGTLLEFSETIASAASGVSGIIVIDGTTLVPPRLEIMPDGTHPNDEGFLHYALNLHKTMSRV
jgi:lysophospholipase L1-like esterase